MFGYIEDVPFRHALCRPADVANALVLDQIELFIRVELSDFIESGDLSLNSLLSPMLERCCQGRKLANFRLVPLVEHVVHIASRFPIIPENGDQLTLSVRPILSELLLLLGLIQDRPRTGDGSQLAREG